MHIARPIHPSEGVFAYARRDSAEFIVSRDSFRTRPVQFTIPGTFLNGGVFSNGSRFPLIWNQSAVSDVYAFDGVNVSAGRIATLTSGASNSYSGLNSVWAGRVFGVNFLLGSWAGYSIIPFVYRGGSEDWSTAMSLVTNNEPGLGELAFNPLGTRIVKAAYTLSAAISGLRYSDDLGVTWVNSNIAGSTTVWYSSVLWSERLGLYVCCGIGGRIHTSTDGANWTLRTTPVAGHDLTGIEERNGWLVAMGGPNVYRSSDGITWATYTVASGLGNASANNAVIYPAGKSFGGRQGGAFYAYRNNDNAIITSLTGASGSWTTTGATSSFINSRAALQDYPLP